VKKISFEPGVEKHVQIYRTYEVVTNHHSMLSLTLQVLPVIIFLSSVVSVLFYWGVMQFIIRKMAWVMQFTMRTTAAESLNAAANIFLGMVRDVNGFKNVGWCLAVAVILRFIAPQLTHLFLCHRRLVYTPKWEHCKRRCT